MHSVIRHTKIAALCAAALVAACGKGDKTADSAKAADSASAGAGAMTPAPATATSSDAWSDANIMAFLDNANMSDSASGSVAASKGTSAAVKAFGRDMVRDHHAMRKDGQDLAKKLNITPEPKPGDTMAADASAFLDSLNSMPKGAAWDKAYIDHAVAAHEKVLSTAQTASGATQNADIKALITKAAPKVQEHLDKAKKIQSTLGAAK